jgi:foldase protein PrsA
MITAVLAACGGGVPGDAVARVGGDSITKDQFNHWIAVAAKSSRQGAPSQATVPPDPPDFKNCIANKTKTTPIPPKGQPKPNPAQFKQQCQQEYNGLRDQVLQFLIQSDWVIGEAKDQGVKVSDADVQKQFDTAKKQAFPKGDADFQKFLAQSGMAVPDILFRFRLDLLRKRLTAKITQGKTNVTPAQISAYYNSHKQQFGQPERRDLLIVLTKSAGKAKAAKAALDHGTSFKAVVKKYSTDPQTKSTGGLLAGTVKGQQDQGLDRAAFSAPKGKVEGPVKAQFGYYVFEVKRITPPQQQPLAAAQAQIRQQLISQGSQSALTSFQKVFMKKWLAKTECRKGFLVPNYCKNAPKPKVTPGIPGAVPQQGATPQQVPQQGGTPQQVPQQGAPQQGTPSPQPGTTTPGG